MIEHCHNGFKVMYMHISIFLFSGLLQFDVNKFFMFCYFFQWFQWYSLPILTLDLLIFAKIFVIFVRFRGVLQP